MRRVFVRSLWGLSGFVLIGVAGPIGDLPDVILDFLNMSRGFVEPEISVSRIGGWATLLAGCVFVAVALGGRHRMVACGRWKRLAFAARFTPLTVATLFVAALLLTRTDRSPTTVSIEAAGIAPGQALEVQLEDELRPVSTSIYRRSLDYLFGLPRGGYGRSLRLSKDNPAHFTLRGPGASFAHWEQSTTYLTVSVKGRAAFGEGHVALELIPVSSGDSKATRFLMKVRDGKPCQPLREDDGFCFQFPKVSYPRDAADLYLRFDFAGTERVEPLRPFFPVARQPG